MYKFKKWNKLDNINGLDANYWISNNHVFSMGDVILYSRVESKNDYTEIIVMEKELRNSYNDFDSDIEILAKMRCDALNEKGFMNMIEAKDKIDILEAEKEKLKEASKEQDDLLVENAYKITMLEMKLGGM